VSSKSIKDAKRLKEKYICKIYNNVVGIKFIPSEYE